MAKVHTMAPKKTGWCTMWPAWGVKTEILDERRPNLRRRMKRCGMAIALAGSFLSFQMAAKNRDADLFLIAHPTANQDKSAVEFYCRDKFLGFGCLGDVLGHEKTEIVEIKDGIMISAKLLSSQDFIGLKGLVVELIVQNERESPIDANPRTVFLVDDQVRVYAPAQDYMANAVVADLYEMPKLSPPPLEKTYTITQTPLDSRAPVPPDPSQPQFTIFSQQVTENTNWGQQLGYAVGYMIKKRRNERAAKNAFEWIDKAWFHHQLVGPGKVGGGWLPFFETQDFVTKIKGNKDPQARGLVRLVVFVEGQQFVLSFGPEVVESTSK
jgi:hypothetical protein